MYWFYLINTVYTCQNYKKGTVSYTVRHGQMPVLRGRERVPLESAAAVPLML